MQCFAISAESEMLSPHVTRSHSPRPALRFVEISAPQARIGDRRLSFGSLVGLTVALGLSIGSAACRIDDKRERTSGALVDTCTGINDGALCNDQNTCTTNDTCRGGLCLVHERTRPARPER